VILLCVWSTPRVIHVHASTVSCIITSPIPCSGLLVDGGIFSVPIPRLSVTSPELSLETPFYRGFPPTCLDFPPSCTDIPAQDVLVVSV
jgi:hypothetical protein